jgi:hypothetical protein
VIQVIRLDYLGRTFVGRLSHRTPATTDVGARSCGPIMTDQPWTVEDDLMLMLNQRDYGHPGKPAAASLVCG